MEQVRIESSVVKKLDALIETLFKQEYFSYLENAETYVIDIYRFIFSIPTLSHKRNGDPIFGAFYCRYTPNKRTSWYVTFDKEGDQYLVQNIYNNHVEDYARFIAML